MKRCGRYFYWGINMGVCGVLASDLPVQPDYIIGDGTRIRKVCAKRLHAMIALLREAKDFVEQHLDCPKCNDARPLLDAFKAFEESDHE